MAKELPILCYISTIIYKEKEKENEKEEEEENGNEKSKENGNETENEKVEWMFTLIHIILSAIYVSLDMSHVQT